MGKPIQKINQGSAGERRVVVFCMAQNTAKRIAQHLEKRQIRVWIVGDEKKLLGQLQEADPELILLEANASTDKPLEEIVAEIFAWMRKRCREINQILGTPSSYLWQHSKIILFESGREMTASGSLSADMADTEYLIRKCAVAGEVHHIGAYSPLNFMSEIRPFLEKK